MTFFEDSWNYSWSSAYENNQLVLTIGLPGYGKEDVGVYLMNKRNINVKTKDDKFNKTFRANFPVGTINPSMANGLLRIVVEQDGPDESITEIEIG